MCTLGEEKGSEGGEAAFEGRVVVLEEGGGVRVAPMEMVTGLTGGQTDQKVEH